MQKIMYKIKRKLKIYKYLKKKAIIIIHSKIINRINKKYVKLKKKKNKYDIFLIPNKNKKKRTTTITNKRIIKNNINFVRRINEINRIM